MSIFDPDPKPVNWTGVPGWELPGHQAELKRDLERQAMSEVMPFEQEKQSVNRQVAENLAIHGPSDLSRYPIEIQGRKA